jgi:hypothetical protein
MGRIRGHVAYHRDDLNPVNPLYVVCNRCEAVAGERCVTRNGLKSSHMHVLRIYLAIRMSKGGDA